MRTQKKKWFISFCIVSMCLLLMAFVSAKEEEPSTLIQGISEESEFLGLLHLGMLQTPLLSEVNRKKAVDNVAPSCVKLKSGNYYGSGTIYQIQDSRIIIVTVRHVIESDTEAQVTFIDGTQATGTVIGISDQNDIAFLEVHNEELSFATLKQLRYLNISDTYNEKLTYGTEVFLCGSADGVAKNTSEGTVLNPEKYFEEFGAFMIHSYCKGEAGLSGCGTFDYHGSFVGMLVGGLDDEIASIKASDIVEAFNNL